MKHTAFDAVRLRTELRIPRPRRRDSMRGDRTVSPKDGAVEAARPAWRAAFVGTVCAWSLGACAAGGALPLAAMQRDVVGFKMIRPAQQARACGVEWGAAPDRSLLRRALGRLASVDPEVDLVRDVQVAWRGVDLVLLRAGCVTIRGDLGARASSVSLPMLDGHEGHHHAD